MMTDSIMPMMIIAYFISFDFMVNRDRRHGGWGGERQCCLRETLACLQQEFDSQPLHCCLYEG